MPKKGRNKKTTRKGDAKKRRLKYTQSKVLEDPTSQTGTTESTTLWQVMYQFLAIFIIFYVQKTLYVFVLIYKNKFKL